MIAIDGLRESESAALQARLSPLRLKLLRVPHELVGAVAAGEVEAAVVVVHRLAAAADLIALIAPLPHAPPLAIHVRDGGRATQSVCPPNVRITFGTFSAESVHAGLIEAGLAVPQPPDTTDPGASLQADVFALWGKFRATMVERVDVIERAVVALMEGSLDGASHDAAASAAHKLVGALGSFGIDSVTEDARLLEHRFESDQPLEPGEIGTLSDAMMRLREAVEAGPPPPESRIPVEQTEPSGPAILVIGADEAARSIADEAAVRGLRAVRAANAAEARVALDESELVAVLLDINSGGEGAGLDLLAEIKVGSPGLPVVVWSDQHAFVDRVEVARRGGEGFLERPLAPTLVLDVLQTAVERTRRHALRVLSVDDDPLVHALLDRMLHDEDVELHGLTDPTRFWETLEAVEPDLLLLDVDMPAIDGLELCRVVRNDLRWGGVPVLVLTGSTRSDIVEEVFRAGADDYVAKPVRGPELVARIRNRAERVRFARHTEEIDELTGVLRRQRSERLIDDYLRLARRQGTPFAFAFLDMDGMKAINDAHGYPVGDRALRHVANKLREAFRSEDVVSRWGGEEFAVAMYGMTRDDATHRLAEVLEELGSDPLELEDGGEVTVTFSAGVAVLGPDGDTLVELHQTADQALYAAKAAGRARVLRTGAVPPAGEATIDIAVVEDDEALADLLMHALATRGYTTTLLSDGPSAAEALTGPNPSVRPRLVLLDVNLPGLDGLTVLRRLVRDGRAEDTRVIMLTARAADDEIVAALDAGAFGHVAKPVSIGVLMQRVRRALAD